MWEFMIQISFYATEINQNWLTLNREFWSAVERRQQAAVAFGLKVAVWVLIFPCMQDTPVESLLVKEAQNKGSRYGERLQDSMA